MKRLFAYLITVLIFVIFTVGCNVREPNITGYFDNSAIPSNIEIETGDAEKNNISKILSEPNKIENSDTISYDLESEPEQDSEYSEIPDITINTITTFTEIVETEPQDDDFSENDSDFDISFGDFSENDLNVVLNGIEVAVGQSIDNIESEIGTPLSIIDITPESEQGDLKKVYNYDCFCIEATFFNEENICVITGIQIFDNSVETEKGIRIGMSVSDAVAVYGLETISHGDYSRYYIDNRYMYLYVPNGIIANIGYGIDLDPEFEN